jgi:hypothetical protein
VAIWAVCLCSSQVGQVGQVDLRRHGRRWRCADACRCRRRSGESVSDYVGGARGVLHVRRELADKRELSLLPGAPWFRDTVESAHQQSVICVDGEPAAFQHESEVPDSLEYSQ